MHWPNRALLPAALMLLRLEMPPDATPPHRPLHALVAGSFTPLDCTHASSERLHVREWSGNFTRPLWDWGTRFTLLAVDR